MKVHELREALDRFDPDMQVVVGDGSAEEWARAYAVERGAYNLGMTTEVCARIAVGELPRISSTTGDCQNCDELQDRIDDARRALGD